MFSYLLNRWAFARRFEKAGEGYIYRRRADLPGVAVSDAERRACLREYRRRYWISTGATFAALVGGILMIAGLSFAIDSGGPGAIAQGGVYVLALAVGIYVFREYRKLAMIPEVRFADRPRVAPAIPTGNWLQRFEMMARNRSWPTHAILLVIYGGITWCLVPANFSASAAHWGAFALFAVCLLALIAGVVLKARHKVQG